MGLGSGEAGRNLVRAVCLTYLWTKTLPRSRESKHEPVNSFKEKLVECVRHRLGTLPNTVSSNFASEKGATRSGGNQGTADCNGVSLDAQLLIPPQAGAKQTGKELRAMRFRRRRTIVPRT
jgi:hypothetical protein